MHEAWCVRVCACLAACVLPTLGARPEALRLETPASASSIAKFLQGALKASRNDKLQGFQGQQGLHPLQAAVQFICTDAKWNQLVPVWGGRWDDGTSMLGSKVSLSDWLSLSLTPQSLEACSVGLKKKTETKEGQEKIKLAVQGVRAMGVLTATEADGSTPGKVARLLQMLFAPDARVLAKVPAQSGGVEYNGINALITALFACGVAPEDWKLLGPKQANSNEWRSELLKLLVPWSYLAGQPQQEADSLKTWLDKNVKEDALKLCADKLIRLSFDRGLRLGFHEMVIFEVKDMPAPPEVREEEDFDIFETLVANLPKWGGDFGRMMTGGGV